VNTPEQIAKGGIAEHGKPSTVSGNLKLTMTDRDPAERSSAAVAEARA